MKLTLLLWVQCRSDLAWKASYKAYDLRLGEAASSADLGCSSEYSIVNTEGWSGERSHVNGTRT